MRCVGFRGKTVKRKPAQRTWLGSPFSLLLVLPPPRAPPSATSPPARRHSAEAFFLVRVLSRFPLLLLPAFFLDCSGVGRGSVRTWIGAFISSQVTHSCLSGLLQEFVLQNLILPPSICSSRRFVCGVAAFLSNRAHPAVDPLGPSACSRLRRDGQAGAVREEGMVHRAGDVRLRGEEDPVLQAAAAEAPRDGKYSRHEISFDIVPAPTVLFNCVVEPTFAGMLVKVLANYAF